MGVEDRKLSDETTAGGSFVEGNDYFKLISDVDNIAFDISVSKETSVGTMRSIKGATLPALLRRLTSIETATQSQILAFLLNMRAIECGPLELLQFLRKRFTLTEAKVDSYASTVRNEIVHSTENDSRHQHNLENRHTDECTSAQGLERGGHDDGEACEHWLLQDRAIIGSHFYWQCSPEELVKHEGDRIAEEALHVLLPTSDPCAEHFTTPLSTFPVLSTLTSVQVGVLLFLETWLNLVPEDFMLCISTCKNTSAPSRAPAASDLLELDPPEEVGVEETREVAESGGHDVLGVLVDFLATLGIDGSLDPLGLFYSVDDVNDRKRATLTPDSLMSRHFPCVSKLCVLVSTHVQVDFPRERDSSGSSSVPPAPAPLQSKGTPPYQDNDREYCKKQFERVLSGDLKDKNSLSLLRKSFFDTFGDDSLSEMLEFESEILSQGSGREGSPGRSVLCHPEADKIEIEEVLGGCCLSSCPTDNTPSTSASTSVVDSMDSIHFFKSLFSPRNSCRDAGENGCKFLPFSDDTLLNKNNATDGSLPHEDSHIINLSSKAKYFLASEKESLLFVPQKMVPSALAAASMGIRMSTLTPRPSGSDGDVPFNAPYGQSSRAREKQQQGELEHLSAATSRPLRYLVVATLARLNEDSFTPCVEMYSYFGMMLSAVELKTAQDYVASNISALQVEVPSRLFVDPIDRYIIRFNSANDALCSEKISYLVKSSREESQLLPVENVRAVASSPNLDRERTAVSPDHRMSDASSRYVYDADFNNSSSAVDQQNKRNKHRKEERRRTVGSFLSERVSRYRDSRRQRQSMLSVESSQRRGVVGSKKSSGPPSRRSFSTPLPAGPESGSFSVSEALFGNSQVYLGPSIFLDFTVDQVAANLTMRLHYMYCTIPMLEFVVDYVYAYDAKSNFRNRTPMLTRFRKESEKLQSLFIGEVLVHPDVSTRAEVVIKMIKVAERLAKLRSHHGLMLVVYALHTHAIHRLKSTWAVVHAKLPGRWDILTELVGMGGTKLVGFFCQRQPRSGISSDIREDMYVDVPFAQSDECNCNWDSGHKGPPREGVSASFSRPFFARMGFDERSPSRSPKRRPHLYSSDSNSSYGGLDCRDEECVGLKTESVLTCERQGVDNESGSVSSAPPPPSTGCSLAKESRAPVHHVPISMRGTASTDGNIRLAFRFMASGQGASTVASSVSGKIVSYKSTDSLAESPIDEEKGGAEGKACRRVPVATDTVGNERPISVHWRVENVTHEKDGNLDDSSSSSERESSCSSSSLSDAASLIPGGVIKNYADGEKKISSHVGLDNYAEKDKYDAMDINNDTDTNRKTDDRHGETLDDLVAQARRTGVGRTGGQHTSSCRRRSYRHLQVHNLSLRPPQSGLGEVRSDNLTSSNAFSGIPVSSQKPFMPFLNGILQKIIRLNELPNFLRSQSSGGTSLSEPMAEASSSRPAREHDHGFLWVQSPGNSSTDPWLMMINFGKWRAISNLLILVRSSQLTPFSLHVDFAVQAMLYRDAMYKSEDDIWERSSELE